MTMIVTRQQAADHLRIDDPSAEADDLDLKILAASEIVLDYLETSASDYETESEDDDYYYASGPSGDDDSETEYNWPYQLQVATLLLVGDMHRYRSSDIPKYTDASLSPAVRAILYPLKTFGISE